MSLGALIVLGVFLSLPGTKDDRRPEEQQGDRATDLSSKHHHHHDHHHHFDADDFVSVFESSLYTGARLGQEFPSPAGLKDECVNPDDSNDDSDDHSDDHSDDSSDDRSDDYFDDRFENGFDDDGGRIPKTAACPGKGTGGTVVVETDEKLQKMIGFGGAFTDAATINFYKLPTDVQDKVCM